MAEAVAMESFILIESGSGFVFKKISMEMMIKLKD